MAGRRRGFAGSAGVCLALALLVGCGGGAAPDSARADVQRMLDRRATAVLERDASAYRSTEAPTGSTAGQLATGAAEFTNLRSLRLASWAYDLTGFRRSGDRATAEAALRYRIRGYDRAPVTAVRTLSLVRDDGRWYVAADEPSGKGTEQLWEQGAITAVRGERSLVLGVGRSERRLRAYAELADRAVPAVTEAWGEDWARRVVVLVPESLDEMAGLLGAPASGYRGIAAVTTGEAGGSAKAPADRIIVNPDAYAVLGDFGKQVVLTHETTHVATRAHTNAATPLWLSEGYADWVGYRATGRTAPEVAPELRRAVAEGRAPDRLPEDTDFTFSGDSGSLARAYESGWLACRLIADRWGEVRLNDFYRAVGAHGKRAGAVESALRDVLGTTPEKFTERWREYVRDQLG
ncbi:hypothetical protein PV416_05400 [Streptomyces ipomoeae]|uniref:lipoprotein n=1 Tax=Streptomyces ipomoeae TaxID=103232 RepID=UPI000662B4DC|nr:lipoprotein [Streptomyces ipomoeae]MDX2695064.1 hypothetical protein [Streptomyces ipomoeae]MDX2820537.1 hypothetical protein [Streptomyces ipomoeae]MDX2840291.1 hypothetical protein [Streptomyces ipomoeae]MDX2875418.1 hypothetical protein [Streptomyces ipomoeae]